MLDNFNSNGGKAQSSGNLISQTHVQNILDGPHYKQRSIKKSGKGKKLSEIYQEETTPVSWAHNEKGRTRKPDTNGKN